MPLRATSISPPENAAPIKTPALATKRIMCRGATLDPPAEFKKLTASLLTPTIRSEIAKMKRTITIIK